MEPDASPFCGKKLHKMERFLEVCLLLLLTKEPGYGYGLMEGLSEFGFSDDELKMGSLYRTLGKMENRNLVSSSWEEASQGPKRHVYAISDEGRIELKEWMELLRRRKKRIEQVLHAYDVHIGKEHI